ncbi:MAG: endonuclease/exonuclease/phosphatase family protein [Clostridia bacterium]|nr:endonuclease/exonuclease/phosphatase family protein [Clostridia bacterium]
MKKALKIIGIVLAAIILIVAGYFAYVFISYHRIGDQPIDVNGAAKASIETGTEYKIVSYNIGFGAYEDDFGFFMDGGDRAWAWSKERLDKNLNNIAKLLADQKADLYLVQEVDIGSTRSYHFDEREYLIPALNGFAYTFAQNYDSPFLFYPITQPHGSAKSGLLTFSSAPIREAERVELPIESGLTKLLDLDRCYSKNRIPLSNGKELVLYNLHLSAYTSDGTIATEQLKNLIGDMQAEYQNGNYCIAGGDFNKDLLGDSSKYFGKSDKEYTWAQPIPEETFDGFNVRLVAPIDEANPVASCRNADGPYHPGQYKLTVDGFMVTDNVEVIKADVIDVAFRYSDHNPVEMLFKLN